MFVQIKNLTKKFKNTLAVNNINFQLCEDFPQLNVCDYFTARFTGQIFVEQEGMYEFRSRTDDGVRLYVDNILVIDDWNTQSPTNNYDYEQYLPQQTVQPMPHGPSAPSAPSAPPKHSNSNQNLRFNVSCSNHDVDSDTSF